MGTSQSKKRKPDSEEILSPEGSNSGEETDVVKRAKVYGKLLVKNCRLWEWKEEGAFSSNPIAYDNILGSPSSLSWFSVQSNGLISNISTYQNCKPPKDSLFETVMDVDGNLLLPGLIDSHIHVMMTGESSYHLNLQDCHSIPQLQDMLKKHSERYPDIPWIIGEKWDQTNLSRYPTRFDLDQAVSDRPVYLWRACWHIGVANTHAIQLANIDVKQSDFRIPGGAIDCTPEMGMTGIFRERAVSLIMKAVGSKNDASKEKLIQRGLQLCSRFGITSLQTNDETALRVYKNLQAKQRLYEHNETSLSDSLPPLPVRVFLTPMYMEIMDDEEAEEKTSNTTLPDISLVPFCPIALSRGRVSASTRSQQVPGNETDDSLDYSLSYAGTRLATERIKIFTDGSLGAETAAIKVNREPGSMESGHSGMLIHTTEELCKIMRTAKRKGFRIECHAIGDAAVEQVLDALELSNIPPSDRPIITHCQVLSESIMQRMYAAGAVADVQPSFVPTDMRWVQQRLKPEQVKYSYPWKTLLQRGIWTAGSSDSPVESYNPFRGIYDAMHRAERSSSTTPDVFRPEECLTFSEALWMYTVAGAYAMECEHILGRLENGFAADFVVVNSEILWEPQILLDYKPHVVVVGGEIVHNATEPSSSLDAQDSEISPQGGPYIAGKNGVIQAPFLFTGINTYNEVEPDTSLEDDVSVQGSNPFKNPSLKCCRACFLKQKFCFSSSK